MEEAVKPTDGVNLAPVTFNATEAEARELAEKYKNLTIAGVNDKEGYKAVHEARMVLRSRRIEIDKREKELNDSANLYKKQVGKVANSLRSIIEPVEDTLGNRETAIDVEIENARQERLKAEQVRIQNRTARLLKLGTSFDGENYELGGEQINTLDIKGFNDEQFDAVCLAMEEKKAEQELKAAEARRLEEEEKAAQLAEFKRQQDELAEAKRKQEEEMATFREEQRKIAEANEAKEKETARLKKIEDDKLEADRKKLADEQAAFKRQQDAAAEKLRQEEQKKLDEAAAIERERKRVSDEKEAKDKADKAEQERIARELALRPDKEKLQSFAADLIATKLPELSDEAAKAVLNDCMKKVKEASNLILNRLKTL